MKQLIDEIVELKKTKEKIDIEIKSKEAELQKEGLDILEDLNIKTIERYGSDNSTATITYTQKLDLLNYVALKEVLGEEFIKSKIEENKKIDYDIDKKFKEAIIIFYTGEYDSTTSLEDFIKQNFTVDTKQLKLLIKKIKGAYKTDKALLEKVLGVTDIDEELYFINKIKNYEKITPYFNIEDEEQKKAIRTYFSLDENIKIGVKYEDD